MITMIVFIKDNGAVVSLSARSHGENVTPKEEKLADLVAASLIDTNRKFATTSGAAAYEESSSGPAAERIQEILGKEGQS